MDTKERLLYLLQQCREQLATPEEITELLNFIKSGSASGDIIDQLTVFQAAAFAKGETNKYDFAYWDKMADEILQMDKFHDEKNMHISSPVRRISFPWRAVAAAIIIFFTAGAYLWLQHRDTHRQPVAEIELVRDSLPANGGAILTLSDGSKVLLDSAGNGVIATQGGTEVKLENGQLLYRERNRARGDDASSVVYNTMTTPKGRLYLLVLPDGTKVWLNAASSLTYPTVFMGTQRKVEIVGEAYFEVVKNIRAPFIVKIKNGTEIEVLGTRFNVNAYDDEASINTTLLEGAVRVKARNRVQVLAPGQQAQVSVADASIRLVKDADLQQSIAWKNGLFSFNDADLKTVMRQLARWYNIEVKYEGEIPTGQFNGEIDNTLSFSQVLRGLAKTRIHYRVEKGNQIVILP